MKPPESQIAGSPAVEQGEPTETVYIGSVSELIILRSTLECLGYPTCIADEHIKTLNPFQTGGNVFATDLRAPAPLAEEVRQTIRELKQVDDARETREEDSSEEGPVRARARSLGRCIRWACLFDGTAPIGLILSVPYLKRAFRLDPRPKRHEFTLIAILMCAIWTLILAFAFGLLIAGAFRPSWIG